MSKNMTSEEKRLQKKLIPLNIVVCIITLIAALSLIIMPILQIDMGKIIKSEAMGELVEELIDEAIGDTSADPESGNVDFTPVISVVVKEVLGKAEGSISITALGSLNVFLAPEDEKDQTLFDELLYNENGLVSELVDSLIDGISHLFENRDFTAAIEKTVVSMLTTQLVSNLPDGVAVSESDLNALTETFLSLGGKDRAEAQLAAEQFADRLEKALGDNYDLGEDKEAVINFIMDLYDDTAETLSSSGSGSESVSVESLICVAVSQNIDLSEINIGDMISGMSGEDGGKDGKEGANTSNSVKYAVVLDGEEEGGSTDGAGGEGGRKDGENGEKVICTSYSQLLDNMGLGANDAEALKNQIEPAVKNMANEITGEYAEYLGYYGYLCFGVFAFALLWIVLFLFSFIRIFTKNKRFMMWYVKLFGFLPCLIFFILPLVAPHLISILLPEIVAGEQWPMILAALGAIKSFTFISGACYLLLWILSICWAFPIKHKIRKVRKQVKNGTYTETASTNYDVTQDSYDSDSYGSGYDSLYEDDGSDGFDDDYSPYGSSLYDDGYDDYGSPYDSLYGRSIFDDDDDDY